MFLKENGYDTMKILVFQDNESSIVKERMGETHAQATVEIVTSDILS